jgi:hypothetical protein
MGLARAADPDSHTPAASNTSNDRHASHRAVFKFNSSLGVCTFLIGNSGPILWKYSIPEYFQRIIAVFA